MKKKYMTILATYTTTHARYRMGVKIIIMIIIIIIVVIIS